LIYEDLEDIESEQKEGKERKRKGSPVVATEKDLVQTFLGHRQLL